MEACALSPRDDGEGVTDNGTADGVRHGENGDPGVEVKQEYDEIIVKEEYEEDTIMGEDRVTKEFLMDTDFLGPESLEKTIAAENQSIKEEPLSPKCTCDEHVNQEIEEPLEHSAHSSLCTCDRLIKEEEMDIEEDYGFENDAEDALKATITDDKSEAAVHSAAEQRKDSSEQTSSKKCDFDVEAAKKFVKEMEGVMKAYSEHAVFNAAKTDIGLGLKFEVILCISSSGEKLRPATVVSKKDSDISPEDVKNLPVWYAETEDGTVTDEVFIQWYSEEFIPKVLEILKKKKLPLKALLLLDHPFSHLGNILQKFDKNFKVFFFPPKTSLLIEPLTHNPMLPELFPKYRMDSEPPKTPKSASVTSANDKHSVAKSKQSSETSVFKPSQEQEVAVSPPSRNSQHKITDYFTKKN
ncbi:hypothetical protein SK128_007278 [Halocaridina rubra]|uniref:DDE-1 domain-containing protein n=1 Tax=Halocaridina rubra TaxID=373956 RepID=A0AAN8WL91_HALRR